MRKIENSPSHQLPGATVTNLMKVLSPRPYHNIQAKKTAHNRDLTGVLFGEVKLVRHVW
jgi:hypothetical protein